MNNVLVATSADVLNSELAQMFEELSGVSLADESRSAGFMELGFDSLFLTQVAQEIQRKYGVKVTFRQMLEDVSSIEALSSYLLPRLSPDAQARLAPAPAQQPVAPAASTAPQAVAAATANVPMLAAGSTNGYESLFQQQLKAMSELMQQQLQVLSQNPRPAAGAAPSAPTVQAISAPAPAIQTADVSKLAPQAEPVVELRTTSRFSQRPKSDSSNTAALSAGQHAFINQLIDRYCARTAKSKQYAQQYRKVLADPRSVSGFRPEWKEMVYSIVC